MKINHIHPVYPNEESQREAADKELRKVFMLMAAGKGRDSRAGI